MVYFYLWCRLLCVRHVGSTCDCRYAVLDSNPTHTLFERDHGLSHRFRMEVLKQMVSPEDVLSVGIDLEPTSDFVVRVS